MDKRFIDSCEEEKLHLSGAVQPHGVLLLADAGGSLLACSDDAAGWLASFKLGLGQPLPEPFRAWMAKLSEVAGSRLHFGAALNCGDSRLDVVLARSVAGQVVIEVTAELPWDGMHRSYRLEITPPASEAELLARKSALVARVAEISGFERVLFYRFREDGDGEVVAEARSPEAYGSYLGLRFPASDVPQIARNLYRLNPWRFIPDAQAAPQPLHYLGETPPDLSYSDLRSVSPVHVLYLANMGVRASLSFPILVGQELWGLVACHHREARQLSQRQLDAMSQEVRAHAMAQAAYWAQRRMQLLDGLSRRFGDIRTILYAAGGILPAWEGRMAEWLAREFACDGAMLCFGSDSISWGLGMAAPLLETVDQWFVRQCPEQIWMGDCLARQIPGFGLSEVAGLLAVKVRLPDQRSLRVYLTRQEFVHDVAWGGNPDKPVEYHDGRFGIAPRRSFEKWVEKRVGMSRPWNNESRLLALKLRELLLEVADHV